MEKINTSVRKKPGCHPTKHAPAHTGDRRRHRNLWDARVAARAADKISRRRRPQGGGGCGRGGVDQWLMVDDKFETNKR